MFELPASKRVRRADLNHNRSSTSPPPSAHVSLDPELASQAQARFAALYGDFNVSEALSAVNGENSRKNEILRDGEQEDVDEAESEQGFEFRLFSSVTDKPATKIVLGVEEDDEGQGAFVGKARDRSYYFAPVATGAAKGGFESMAVSGETILAWRNIRARGLEVPWRVKTIKVHRSSRLKPDGSMIIEAVMEDQETKPKKCKPNKKRRLLLREKQRKIDKLQEDQRKKTRGKEEAEKEKRIRLNRAKKLKRREKEKAEKAKKAGGAATMANTGSVVDTSIVDNAD